MTNKEKNYNIRISKFYNNRIDNVYKLPNFNTSFYINLQKQQYTCLFHQTKHSVMAYEGDVFLNPSLIHTHYNFLVTSKFIQFFNNLLIDIPVCFKKSNSLYRLSNELTFLKLVNFFMKKGKKLQTQILILNSLLSIFHKNYLVLNAQTLFFWKLIYINLKNSSYTNNYNNSLFEFDTNLFSSKRKIYNLKFNIFNFFFKKLFQLLPVFSFYIYKVDKHIYKNTRGRSGKFTFIWKYVTPYKRFFWVLHWLFKELKFQTGRTYKTKLLTLFNTIFFNPDMLFLHKIKKFSYNYVYYNCKNSLQKTYKTVIK